VSLEWLKDYGVATLVAAIALAASIYWAVSL
jgi:hypothetical protein